jgi:hypothetical protein
MKPVIHCTMYNSEYEIDQSGQECYSFTSLHITGTRGGGGRMGNLLSRMEISQEQSYAICMERCALLTPES